MIPALLFLYASNLLIIVETLRAMSNVNLVFANIKICHNLVFGNIIFVGYMYVVFKFSVSKY